MAKCRKFIVNFPSTYNLVPTHFSIEIKTVGSNFQFVRRPGRKAVIFLAQTRGTTLICTEGRAVFRLEVEIVEKNSIRRPKAARNFFTPLQFSRIFGAAKWRVDPWRRSRRPLSAANSSLRQCHRVTILTDKPNNVKASSQSSK